MRLMPISFHALLFPLFSVFLSGCTQSAQPRAIALEVSREHMTTFCLGDYCPKYIIHKDGKVSLISELCADGNCWDLDNEGKRTPNVYSTEKDCHALGQLEGSAKSGSVRCHYVRQGSVIEKGGKYYLSFPFAQAPLLEPVERKPDGTYIAVQELRDLQEKRN